MMYWDHSCRILHRPGGPRFEVLVDRQPWSEAVGFGNDLILTANINFFGASNVVPTPEPSTAMLLALGLVGMAASRQRLGRKR